MPFKIYIIINFTWPLQSIGNSNSIQNLFHFQVKGVFIDTRAASAPANILPKAKPLLHSLRAKDPVELENCGYVSSFYLRKYNYFMHF